EPRFLSTQCVMARCNSDRDCRNGSVCDSGACFKSCVHGSDCNAGEACVRGQGGRVCAPNPVATGGGDGGSPGSGVGAACGAIQYGPPDHPIIKHIGCGPRLQCVLTPGGSGRGTCQRPPS